MQDKPINIFHYAKDSNNKRSVRRSDPASVLVSVLSQAAPATTQNLQDCEQCKAQLEVEQIIEGNGNVQIVSHIPQRQIIRGDGNLQADLKSWAHFMQRSS